MDAVARLIAAEEIKRLKARYTRFVDTARFDDLRALFTDDAEFDLAAQGRFTGADAMVAGMRERRRTQHRRTVHHCHTPEIDVLSADEATGIWAMSDIVEVEPRDGSGERQAFVGWGHYHERYRREAGVWRIASLRIERLRIDVLPPSHFLHVFEPQGQGWHAEGPACGRSRPRCSARWRASSRCSSPAPWRCSSRPTCRSRPVSSAS